MSHGARCRCLLSARLSFALPCYPSAQSTGSLSSKYWLSLSPQPPRHPFVGVWFPLKVFLIDSKKSLKSGWPLKLHVELLYENGEVVPNQPANLEIHGCNLAQGLWPSLGNNGSVDLKIRILSVSMAHENKSFFLRFTASAVQDKQNLLPSHVTIMPATSTTMSVIRHRLHITEQPPPQWYKDEGGRDKCIALNALLLDEHDQPVQGREVPLKVLLAYEGEECVEVKNQSILKMPLESVPKVDRHGKVAIKVRIEEVSKNHQKQAFVLKIVPDVLYSPDHGDISADVSTPITVLSKRNKRRPKRDGAEEDSPEMAPAHAPAAYASNAALFNLAAPAAAAAASSSAAASVLPYSQAAGLTKLANLNASIVGGGLAQANSSALPSITPTGGLAKPPNSLAHTSLNGHMMARITSADGSMVMGDASGGSVSGFSSPSFSDTISHLINWAQHVHDLLSKIEWQHVGFEVQEDGTMNLHRPLYRCPGCWSVCTQTARDYRDTALYFVLVRFSPLFLHSHVLICLFDLSCCCCASADCRAYQDTIRQTGHQSSCKISKLNSAYRTHVHVYLQDLLNMASGGTGAGAQPLQHTMSTSNPTALASANQLMAAYSKSAAGAGNSYSIGGSGAGGAGQFGLTHNSSLSGLPRITSLTGPSGGTGLLQRNPSLNLHLTLKPEPSTSSAGGVESGLGMASDSDEPASKKAKTGAAAAASGANAGATNSSALFPPPAADWSNLAAMEPLSSPNALLIDRGLSALGPASMLHMGGSAADRGVGSDGLVGSTAFANLGPFQGGGAGSHDFGSSSNDLPDTSLSLMRAGSSINLDALMSTQIDESNVDAIHVTATPFGFPAFSSAHPSAAATSAAAAAGASTAPSSLQGFYQYDESTTFLAFVPLSRFTSITPTQVAEIEKIFRALRSAGGTAAEGADAAAATGGSSSSAAAAASANSRILTLAQCITREKLKEEALLLHYASQAGSDNTHDSQSNIRCAPTAPVCMRATAASFAHVALSFCLCVVCVLSGFLSNETADQY